MPTTYYDHFTEARMQRNRERREQEARSLHLLIEALDWSYLSLEASEEYDSMTRNGFTQEGIAR